MSQTKRSSFVEAIVGTAIGLLVAIFATQLVCWMHSIPMKLQDNLTLTAWLTVVSIIRSYFVRRLFNKVTDA